jgi:hypothetical protein
MPGPNLILNPGFETGNFTDWAVTDPQPQNPDIGVDSFPEDVHSGSYGVFAGNETTTLSQTIATTVGDIYNIGFYLDVYQSTAFDGGVTVTFGGQTAVNLTEPTETDSFTEYTATVTATSASSTLEFTFTDPGGYFGLDDVSVADEAACYVRGTRILTDRGEVRVERLAIGDLVITACGGLRPIRWLGYRRIDISRHPNPSAVRPVCVSAGAFGGGLPRCNLWLSPGHNVASEGALMPISCLMNGRSVAQIERDEVEYWHVELDAHDVILAEGLPAESYLDCGNRTAFANGGAFVEAHPDFQPKHWAETCLPLVKEGPKVKGAKERLLVGLFERGLELTHDADAHILADGLRIEPIWLGERRLAFQLPKDCKSLVLKSDTFIPAYVRGESEDLRELGLCVARLRIDGEDVAPNDEALSGFGWHEAECENGRFQRRWTCGEARLPCGARIVVIDLAGHGYYWRERQRPMRRVAQL